MLCGKSNTHGCQHSVHCDLERLQAAAAERDSHLSKTKARRETPIWPLTSRPHSWALPGMQGQCLRPFCTKHLRVSSCFWVNGQGGT